MDNTLTLTKIAAPASTDPREFLAMRARQKKAHIRVRRLKLAFITVGLAGMVGAALTMPRWRQRIDVPQQANAASLAAAPAVSTATPAPPPEAPGPAASDTAAVVVTEPATPADASAASRCEETFSHRQWRAAVASCTTAFEATPGEALAMKIAHASWSHGAPLAAGQWAARALKLGTADADAFVLIGHAERRGGHPEKAIAAYRRYLRLAPYGWHAQRVRAAIRELKPQVAADEAVSPS